MSATTSHPTHPPQARRLRPFSGRRALLSRTGHELPLDIARGLVVLGMVIDMAVAPPWLSLLTASHRFTFSAGLVAGQLIVLLVGVLFWRVACEIRLALALQQPSQRAAAITSVSESCGIDRFTAFRWTQCEPPRSWTPGALP